MRNVFTSTTPAPVHERNAFDLSHEKKLSFKLGQLIPIYWEDIIPGDQISVNSEIFIRFAPMLAPVLHRIDVYTHYFWVPYRLCMPKSGVTYADWEGFITDDPESEFTNETLPYVTMNNTNKAYFAKGYLADYFGLPVIDSGVTVTQAITINVLPFFAYHLVYDNYYRDQNLIGKRCGITTAYTVPLIGGSRDSDVGDICTLPLIRAWEKDYFTSALPTAYNGTSSDIDLSLDILGQAGTGGLMMADNTNDGLPASGAAVFNGSDYYLREAGPGNPLKFRVNYDPTLDVTLEMYELRRAMALTRALEAEQRGGKRYVEMLLGVFGVISDDYRSAIPVYLGGGKQAVQISSVLSTTQALDPTCGLNDSGAGEVVVLDPQANMAGHALSVGKTNSFSKYFTEHGIVLGIMSVLPRTAYQDGIERYWRKDSKFDFFNPFLQRIGDQEILQSEVYYDPVGSDANNTFGYTPRWAEYKFKNSSIHGDFRDDFDYWHLGRKFASAPSLNSTFVQANIANDELNRIFAVETAAVDKLYAQVYNSVRAIRPMLLHDIPK